MATFLYSVGRMAVRWRWLVTLLWVAVLAAAGFAATKASAAPDDGFALPGLESQKAFDLMDERFPGSGAEGASARIVFVAPDGQKVTATQNREAIEELVDEAADGAQVVRAVDPFQAKAVSEDGTIAYSTVTFQVKAADLTDASKEHLEKAVDQARDSGLTVETGGNALATQPSAGGTAEAMGIAVAAVVLLITFGSMAAAGLPLLTAIIGVAISMTGIIALGSTFGLSLTTGTLASMLGLACGIDYALFVVSRYREERSKGHDSREAAALAAGTAGSAVVFAGLTVVIALAGLSVVDIPMLTKMGLAAAAAVVIAVLICLTLVPALLGFWPNAVLARRVRKSAKRDRRDWEGTGPHHDRPATDNAGARWARLVVRRPLPVLLLGVIGLGALAVPAADLQLGMPGDEAKPTSTTERRAYDALAEGFGPGFNGPLTLVVDTKNSDDPQAAVTTISKEIAETDGIVSVSPPQFNQARDAAIITATPSTAPTDTATMDLVKTIRGERQAVEKEAGATYEVTGSTAANIDFAEKFQSALMPYLIVVVGLAIALLMLVFRSILVPLKAALGYLLSVLAALGSVVLVFQHGYGAELLGVEQTGPIMSMMPIFLVGIVFGLAMDYEVFLVSRIREAHVHGESPRQAIISGFRSSSRVVVAAALIMMAVFAGFVGSTESMIKMIGFGLAVAVFFDAIIVRMAIVPAVLTLLGDRAWRLPRWLDRMLPDIDVEGEALTRKKAPAGPPTHPRESEPAYRG
ncbi:MMPL family transporter [Streptomyces sp. DH41]|uniref:MMPL family transporter n=1 Tax=Streptomyces sp. DH41 TaxID=3040125 RepID=UPI0024420AAC|nr:MMPL family transporter [Streptomyces sp. DH41]MDG9724362.1 MMPL family transporter [Streptomyces sp. DH41]